MPLSLEVSGSVKDTLAISLAAILLSDSSVDISAENLTTVLTSSGLTLPAYYAPLFAGYIAKAGGVDKFLAGPSAGGAAPAAGAAAAAGAPAAAAAAPKEAAKPKEEEVDALDGGMDMFGGSGGGGDY